MATSKLLEQFCNMHCILEENEQKFHGGLFLGDFQAAIDHKKLREKNIRTIITCDGSQEIHFSQLIVHHVYEDIVDNSSFEINKYFEESSLAIQEGMNRGSVLVHCTDGVSCSPTIVIAFIMKRNQWAFGQAYNYIKNKRIIICPNQGFQQQLRSYEKIIQRDIKLQKKQEELLSQEQTLKRIRVQSAHLHKKQLSYNFSNNQNKNFNNIGNKQPFYLEDNNFLAQQLKKLKSNNNNYENNDILQNVNNYNLQDINLGTNRVALKTEKSVGSKHKYTNSQVKLQKFADKLSREECELKYNKFEYKPGYKRITQQQNKALQNSIDSDYQKLANANKLTQNQKHLNQKLQKIIEDDKKYQQNLKKDRLDSFHKNINQKNEELFSQNEKFNQYIDYYNYQDYLDQEDETGITNQNKLENDEIYWL